MKASAPGPVASSPSPWAVFATVGLGTAMATLDSSITNVALPTLARTFAVPVTVIEWVPLAYLVTLTALLSPAGWLADAWGRRRIYVLGFGVFTASSLLCATAGSVGLLVAFRVVQAMGSAMMGANSAALVTAAFPAAARGRALGLLGASVGIGLTVGPPLGGFLLSVAGWPAIFLVNLPIGAIGIAMGLSLLPRDPARAPAGRAGFDLAGAALALVALLAFTLVLSRGPAWGWSSPATMGLAVVALVAAGAFVLAERKATHPLVAPALVRHPIVASSLASLFLSFAALFAAVFLVPFYLERVGGLGPAEVGRVLVIVPLMLLAISPVSGALSDRVGSRVLTAFGLALTALGLGALSILMGRAGAEPLGTATVLGALLVVGLGQGLFQPPNASAALGAVPATQLGLTGGLLASMRNLGMLTGVAVAAAVYEGRERVYHAQFGPVAAAGLGMRDAFAVAALVAAIASAVAFARGAEEATMRAGERNPVSPTRTNS